MASALSSTASGGVLRLHGTAAHAAQHGLFPRGAAVQRAHHVARRAAGGIQGGLRARQACGVRWVRGMCVRGRLSARFGVAWWHEVLPKWLNQGALLAGAPSAGSNCRRARS